MRTGGGSREQGAAQRQLWLMARAGKRAGAGAKQGGGTREEKAQAHGQALRTRSNLAGKGQEGISEAGALCVS